MCLRNRRPKKKKSASSQLHSPFWSCHTIFYTESRQVFPCLYFTAHAEFCSRMPAWPLRVGSWLFVPGALTIGCSTDKWVLSEPTQPWTTFFSYICQSNGGAGAALKKLGHPHPCFGNIWGPLIKKKKHTHNSMKSKLIEYSQHRINF